MKNTHLYTITSAASFCAAVLFFAIYNQWIIFRFPLSAQTELLPSAVIQKKTITHYYFHGDKWKTEKQELLWSEGNEKNIFQLINAWFTLLDEEHILAKKTTVQSVLISTAACAYISFDHNIMGKEDAIFKKWVLIEGLLKTMVINGIAIHHVQFLVQHQPLLDAHLDFSQPWLVHGFIKS